MTTALVVPTIRPEKIEDFLAAWQEEPFDAIYIIEDHTRSSQSDSVKPSTPNSSKLRWYSHKEIVELEGAYGIDYRIISRRDSAIRCFGFYRAWVDGHDLIVTLDDDVRPTGAVAGHPYLVEQHYNALHHNHSKWASTITNRQLRGMPYENLGSLEAYINMGMWCGDGDLDAPHRLVKGKIDRWSEFDVTPCGSDNVLAYPHQYIPICGMNLAFRAHIIPVMYFPPMGVDRTYRRFDDIWWGLLAQRIFREIGMPISYGRPVVEHKQGSNALKCLVAEAPGIEANETMWTIIESLKFRCTDIWSCAEEAGEQLAAFKDETHSRYESVLKQIEFVREWGAGLLEWLKLLKFSQESRDLHEEDPDKSE